MDIEPLDQRQLPVKDDIILHKKGWVIQRIGWTLMFLFLLAAVLGLFGEGPLSKRKVHLGPVTVEYERFGRYEHAMRMNLRSAGENIGMVSLPQNYLKSFKISKIVPEPAKQVSSPGYVNYFFEGDQNDMVTFFMDPSERQNAEGVIRVNNHSFPIKQTIFP